MREEHYMIRRVTGNFNPTEFPPPRNTFNPNTMLVEVVEVSGDEKQRGWSIKRPIPYTSYLMIICRPYSLLSCHFWYPECVRLSSHMFHVWPETRYQIWKERWHDAEASNIKAVVVLGALAKVPKMRAKEETRTGWPRNRSSKYLRSTGNFPAWGAKNICMLILNSSI